MKPRTERGASLDRSPEIAERGEVYDAVNTDDLGAEWLTRATESLPARRSPLPEPELRFDPIEGERISDADLVLESESPHTEGSEAHSKRTRPPPRVFDVADLPPEQDARTTKTRNS